MLHKLFLSSLLLSFIPSLFAQDGKMRLSGSVQSDWLVAENDEAIGANKDDYRGTLLGNTYINLNFDSKYVTAGVRFETMEKPLPGYENLADTKPFYGTGLPYFQVTASNHKWIEATAGTFYEQFGSGFVLRAYEERTIGIDNSILGGRVVLTPYKGIRLKMLGGIQRYHFSWNDDNPVFGADLELELSQWSKALTEKGHVLTFGVSGVTRYDDETKRNFRTFYFNPNESQPILNSQTITLNLPKQVSAMDFRLQWQHSGYNILAEYAMKSHDPSADNSFIFRHGSALMLSASYSKRGFSTIIQAKRSEDMGFRSDRTASPTVTSLYLNHQPAFAYQHTYTLATQYPYATQMDGEWAFQGEVSYRFKRNTPMGGKYGTLLRLNASHIRGLDKKPVDNSILGTASTKGYDASFFGMSDQVYYQDINLTMEKKLNKKWKLTTMYINQQYNMSVIEDGAKADDSNEIVKTHIFVADASYVRNPNFAIRMEGQYMITKQDEGDWAYALAEFSFLKDYMISISDEYNTGIHGGTDTHYFNFLAVWNYKSSRLQLGYGRTSEGLNCTGGVCRKVPAQRGFTASWYYVF
ncbi:MAG: hypothetical protein IKH58_14460 [Bacteroidales bacterium]|nr:hypothetical protein [Bacteroidales bacterium]